MYGIVLRKLLFILQMKGYEMKLYTKEQILKRYKGKYIKVIPHFYEKRKREKWIPLFEITGVSKTIRENYQMPEEATDDD